MWFLHPHGFVATHISVLVILLAVALDSQADEGGITGHVANNGADSTSCGTKVDPCRSIGRAIQKASDGDTILVGPGFYGDANSDGDFADLGDELLDATSFPGVCLVCVNKRVRLLSTHGADLTIIDGSGTESFGGVEGVSILVPGVSFGAESHGFTVKAFGGMGVLVQPTAGDVSVEGNHASGSGVGFTIWVGQGLTRVRSNLATNNSSYGFFVALGGVGPGSARIVDNAAKSNLAYGFVIESGAGPAYSVVGNVAASNGGGFSIDGIGHLVRRNIAINNNQAFGIEGENSRYIRLVGNSIIGNRVGMIILPDVPGPIDIHRSNLYGNVGGGSSSEPNCAITNQSAARIDARNNFWGLPSGPGPDPADEACNASAEGEILVEPFATKPFPIPAKRVKQVKSAQDEHTDDQ
jgi:hypothetical protein